MRRRDVEGSYAEEPRLPRPRHPTADESPAPAAKSEPETPVVTAAVEAPVLEAPEADASYAPDEAPEAVIGPVVELEPVFPEEHVAVEGPVAEEEPVAETEPVVELAPVADAPVADVGPVVDVEPIEDDEPPVAEVEPVEVHPVEDAHPAEETHFGDEAGTGAFGSEPAAPVVELAPPVVEEPADPPVALAPEPNMDFATPSLKELAEDVAAVTGAAPEAEDEPPVPVAEPEDAQPEITIKSVETVSAIDLIMGADESDQDSTAGDEPSPGATRL